MGMENHHVPDCKHMELDQAYGVSPLHSIYMAFSAREIINDLCKPTAWGRGGAAPYDPRVNFSGEGAPKSGHFFRA